MVLFDITPASRIMSNPISARMQNRHVVWTHLLKDYFCYSLILPPIATVHIAKNVKHSVHHRLSCRGRGMMVAIPCGRHGSVG